MKLHFNKRRHVNIVKLLMGFPSSSLNSMFIITISSELGRTSNIDSKYDLKA